MRVEVHRAGMSSLGHVRFLFGPQPALSILYAFSLCKFTWVSLQTEAGRQPPILQLLSPRCMKRIWRVWPHTWWPLREMSDKIPLTVITDGSLYYSYPWFHFPWCHFWACNASSSCIFQVFCCKWLHLQDDTMPNLMSLNASPRKCKTWSGGTSKMGNGPFFLQKKPDPMLWVTELRD